MPRRLPTFLTEPQMVALALAHDPASRKGTRDRAILALLLACGLRASELCQLQPRDISPSLVFVRHGKFGHQRFVPISKRAHAAISHYLAAHPAQAGGPLFRTLDDRPLNRRLLHKLVVSYSRPLGLPSGVHLCRHSAATRWLNRGINLQSVRVMLGHVSISTTAVYLGTAAQALVAEYRRCLEQSPVGGGTR